MAPSVQRPPGTQDLLPSIQPYWEAMSEAAKRRAEQFGYQRIATPIYEPTELFVRGVGEATDIVSKEMYSFTDRGGRSLTLRPEGTAPIVRAYFDAGMHQEPQPVRLYYLGPFFRAERPQRGRYHEFRQFGIEAIGDPNPLLDVEAIVLGWQWFATLGLRGISLQLNSIGDEVCRPAYRDRLRDYYRPHLSELSNESRVRFEQNPLRLFDSKDQKEQELKRRAPRIVDHLCPACAEAFAAVKAGLEAEQVPFNLNPELVRGLDYYTRTVFEFQHESLGGAQNALGGGGRYDGLAAALGYRPTPGIGFALGMDRTAMVMQEAKRLAQNVPDVWAIAVDTPDSLHVLHLAENLRAQGHSVVMDPSHGRLDAKLRRAAKRGARVVIMVGPDERDKDEVVVRNMVAQTQVSVPQRDLVATVSSALGPA
jgi:histidyl-tRNA synthetase